ncbi:MAG: PBP1A family penicillin-binding protein [Patescibacteria group bacterium]|nr:PBP1A family penicillin-binding protein [Patescibacteria group bacterium]
MIDIKIKIAILLIVIYFLGKLIIINELGMKKKKTSRSTLKKSTLLKSKRPKKLKKYKKLKLFLIIVGISMVIGIFGVVGLFIYYAKDLPDPEKVNRRVIAESTKIFDRTGEHLLYEIHGEEKRTIIPIEEIPGTVRYATIVLEDQMFYSHHGIDFRGILRAVMKDVLKREASQGGSTITQQFIKNSILTSEKKLSRKIKEVILAIEIEQKFGKDDILRMYLNEIPYGSNAYGIEAAAQTFFGVHAKELTLVQSALLASLPKAPTYYSPHGSHIDRLLSRWRHTLDQMANLGYITKEQAEDAKNEDILAQVKTFKADIKAPHFVLYVKEKLVEEFGEDKIEKQGLKVITTLDWDMQQLGEKVIREGVEENGGRYGFSNSALVAINPKNGQVLAMVGSKDYFNESIDGNVNVAIRLRQPGSSFKPYVYAQAFREGYRPETVLFDVETEFSTSSENKYKPQNYDGSFHGPVKMKNALARSLNIPAVKTLYLAGVKDSIKLAKAMGITSLDHPSRYGLALVLGGGEVKLIDHVAAFSVFANEGIKHDQRVILKIEDNNGNILNDYSKSEGKRVLEQEVALQICSILSDNKLRSPAFGANNVLVIPGKTVMGKTGTTNEYRDGWLVGSSPSLAAGVWSGNNDNTAMKAGAAGVNVSGPTWHKFMEEALKNYQDEKFAKPKKLEKTDKPVLDGTMKIVDKVKVCKYNDGKYCLANSKCPEKKVKKKKYFVAHNILHYIDKNDPLGDQPKRPKDDPQYKKWERAVERWGEKKADGKGRDPVPQEECKAKYFSSDFSNVKIAFPTDGEIINNQIINIEASIFGDAKIKQVDFFFDGDNIGSRTKTPYEISYTIPESKNYGTSIIRVKIYNEEGGSDEDEVEIAIEIPDSEFSAVYSANKWV